MAAVKEYWTLVHKNSKNRERDCKPYFYDSCIFQQQWNETCKVFRICGSYHNFKMQHVEYITRLLLDGLLEHNFDTAARCIMGLSGNIKQVPELVWRVGCEVLRTLKRNHACIVQFFKYTFMLCYPYQEEILLDFAMYLIQEKQELTEAYELIRGKCGNKPFDTNKLLKAYLGLCEYISWKTKEMKLLKQSSLEQDLDTSSNTMEFKQISFHNNKAMSFFEDLVETDGLWDIFITRQAEMLVYHGRVDEARGILERYQEKNPENPNAHRYLYHFLKKQGATQSKMKAVLEKLFAVDPTSELVKEYKELLQQNAEPDSENPKSNCSMVCILFNKLDHYSCHNCLEDWKALAELLDGCYLDKPVNTFIDQTIQECWEERADWWPQYHFQEQQLLKTDSMSEYDWNVILEKARVAHWLLSEDEEFVKAVQKLNEVKVEISTADKDQSTEEDPVEELSGAESESFKRNSKQLKRKMKCNTENVKKKKWKD